MELENIESLDETARSVEGGEETDVRWCRTGTYVGSQHANSVPGPRGEARGATSDGLGAYQRG